MCPTGQKDEPQRTSCRNRNWVSLGLFIGTLTTWLLCIYLIFIYWGKWQIRHANPILILLCSTPFYMAVWGTVLSREVLRNGLLKKWMCLATATASIPFWIGSFLWSKKLYRALPAQAPDCFVVTAAMHGHESWVGPLFPYPESRTGKANRQLLVFRAFEKQWALHGPVSHKGFRAVYNHIGPLIAHCVRTPLAADALYLLLKPLEWTAQLICSRARTLQNLHNRP
jgi:hypothetical protein